MKLATKLLIAPVLTALLVFGAGQLNAWLTVSEAHTNQVSAKDKSDNVRILGSVHEQLGFIHAQMYRTIALISSLDDKAIKGFRDDIATQLAGIKRLTGKLIGGEGADTVLHEAVKKTAELSDKYLAQTDMAIDLSSVDPNTGIAALRAADESFAALSKTLSEAVDHMDQRAAAELVASNQHIRQTNLLLAALSLVAAGVAIFLSWLAQRRVVRDLHRAVKVAGAVSTGNLTLHADTDRTDEVGDLMRALDAMTAQLRLSMGEVLQSSEQIRTASAEIATGNMDLSSRTEQTAANLQQTSASMAQLTGTVQQSTEASYRANELAASAADVAARGGAVVGEVVETMQDINQSSRKIADIIGVIDGIAFQTNILALNAAVEAARAGEQGRGFAVVASEVRSLAQRSAQAAKEIKSLIDTSVEKVEAGTRLVADAGSTMNEIVASVKRVSDMIGEITSAAAEQSQGIGQISSAVTHLDDMTQQNAALVEESAAAAQSLSTQAQRLREVVNQFQIGQADESSPSAGATAELFTEPPSAPASASAPVAASTPKPASRPPARSAPKPVAAADKPAAKPAPQALAATAADDGWETF